MTAAPGSSEYGTLSVLLSATGDIKTIRVLKPTVFWPQPQVDSAMVRFVRQNGKVARIRDIQLFSQTVNLFMGHRRKMLKACARLAHARLGNVNNWPAVLEQCSIDPTQRPQQLSAEDYIAIDSASRAG
jgi:16S rRNA (adenine1518-N6/adenine1519-N6)-dimethyltransferase